MSKYEQQIAQLRLYEGRQYVQCAECDGWYQLRGFRGFHAAKCDGTLDPDRKEPPIPLEESAKVELPGQSNNSGTDANESNSIDSKDNSQVDTLEVQAGNQTTASSVSSEPTCANCGASDYVPAERAKQDLRDMNQLTPEVEEVLTQCKYYCNSCFHAFDP